MEQISLKKFTEEAYLNYAMSVILDRALPRLEDGLKPVQRRIIYAMSELGLKNTAKFKKSARTVGDVLGKYHPHGDTACYEAMVLMAQNFSYRYPLIEGQGNWGSIDDPKSFAAMRYTEARLANYTTLLLRELELGTIDWGVNFDGTLKEPILLPAEVPNILLNGTMGIAVGMSTYIPPHNLTETLKACIALLENSEVALETLLTYLPAPDFPTGGEIINTQQELADIYRNGTGTIKLRATYRIENQKVIITSLPYQISSACIEEQLAHLMQTKQLPTLEDFRDESDHQTPVRLVLSFKGKTNLDEMMLHLFAKTQLENNYHINLNMIGLNRRPQVKGLRQILAEWLDYRENTIIKRLTFCSSQIKERLNIINGLLIVFNALEEVIWIIREADQPRNTLMKRFHLNENQVDAILELKLKALAKLEELKLKQEQSELQKKLNEYQNFLLNPKKLIKTELLTLIKQFGDERKTKLVVRPSAKLLNLEKDVPNEPVTVILSEQGWIRLSKNNYPEVQYKNGDHLKQMIQGKLQQPTIVLDQSGQIYTLKTKELPSNRTLGEPLSAKLDLKTPAAWLVLGELDQLVLFSTEQGYGFISPIKNLITKYRQGKNFLKIAAHYLPLEPMLIQNFEGLMLLTSTGKISVISLKAIPLLNRGKGVKLINLNKEEKLSVVKLVNWADVFQANTTKGQLTIAVNQYRQSLGKRGKNVHLIDIKQITPITNANLLQLEINPAKE